jgi:hypothetical protein
MIEDAVGTVKHEDERRDHSLRTLNKYDNFEIQIYNYIKNDPYYKHHVRNYIREFSE